MARGNTYTCVVCGEKHIFCDKCTLIKPKYDYERYCSAKHAEIFATLSKHGCHLSTAEETLDALDAIGIDNEKFTAPIQAHIDSLFGAETEVEPTDEEITE